MSTPPVALTIAGSDSGGGAGIQADLATFAVLGVHGSSAVTAVTVQDTTGVQMVHCVPVDVVLAQIRVVLADLRPAAVKVGMLGTADTVAAVGDLAAAGSLSRLVVDPVLVSSSGQPLAADGVLDTLRRRLVPHAELVTPNTAEAAALLDCEPATTLDEQTEQASALLGLGCRAVVVTGRTEGQQSRRGTRPPLRVDVLATASAVRVFSAPEVLTHNDHGTGCTFASAVASCLARDVPLPAAIEHARCVVRKALRDASTWRLGQGRGPVSHVNAHPDLTLEAPRGEH